VLLRFTSHPIQGKLVLNEMLKKHSYTSNKKDNSQCLSIEDDLISEESEILEEDNIAESNIENPSPNFKIHTSSEVEVIVS